MPRTSSKGGQPISGANNSGESNNNNNIRASLSANNNSNSSNSANNPNQRGSPGGRFGHFPKYTKPKIGPAFQCAVPKFIPPNNNNNTNTAESDDNANGDSSEAGGTTSGSRTSNTTRAAAGGRGGNRGRGGRGRGGRGNRGGRGGGGGSNKHSSSASSSSSLITDMGGKQDANLEMLGARPEEMANAAAELFVCNVGKRTIPRGGLCVHRPTMAWQRSGVGSSDVASAATTTSTTEADTEAPTDRHDDYLLYTRNIFLQTPQPRGEMTIDQIWDDAAQKKFGSMTLTSSSLTGKKKGRKRKADENDGDDGSKCKSPTPPPHDVEGGSDGMDVKPSASAEPLLTQPQKPKPTMMPMCGLEDDERMLSFLQAKHGGDMEKAKFSIMVNSDRGHGRCLLVLITCHHSSCCILV